VPGIQHPGSTGVIYCSDRAMANGFSMASADEWANFGQGAPEVGPIPGCPPRPESVSIPLDSMEYAPTTGVKGTSGRTTSSAPENDITDLQSCAKLSPIFTTTHTARVRRVNTPLKTSALSLVEDPGSLESLLSLAMSTL
jgi:hypothetical protein